MTNRDQDLIELMKEAAAKATPGERTAEAFGTAIFANGKTIASVLNPINATKKQHPVPSDLEEVKANAALIALCSPDNILSLIDRLATLQSELDEARGALAPFANLAYGYDDKLDPDDRPVGPFKLGLCRRARAALSQKETGR